MGPRGYYRYPWPKRALRVARELAGRCSLRAIARELRARHLVRELVNPSTLARALRRRS
jgi:hypothetical protein